MGTAVGSPQWTLGDGPRKPPRNAPLPLVAAFISETTPPLPSAAAPNVFLSRARKRADGLARRSIRSLTLAAQKRMQPLIPVAAPSRDWDSCLAWRPAGPCGLPQNSGPVPERTSRPCLTPRVAMSRSASARTSADSPLTTMTSRQLSWSRWRCSVDRIWW